MGQCQDCKWFSTGDSPSMRAVSMHSAITGKSIPQWVVAVAAGRDKDGACTLMPETVRKRKTDGCGQFAGRAALAQESKRDG